MKRTVSILLAAVMLVTLLSGCSLLKKEDSLQEIVVGDWTLTADLEVISGFIPEGERGAFSIFAKAGNLFLDPISMDATFNEDGTMHLELSQAGSWLEKLLGLLDKFLSSIFGSDTGGALGESGGVLTSILDLVEEGIGDFHYRTEGDQIFIWGFWQSEEEAIAFTCEYKDDVLTVTEIQQGGAAVEISSGSLKLTRRESV